MYGCKHQWTGGGSPCLEVMGDDSCSRGRGFKSLHWILHGHVIFTLICCKTCLFGETKIKRKRGQGWPTFEKKISGRNVAPPSTVRCISFSRQPWESWSLEIEIAIIGASSNRLAASTTATTKINNLMKYRPEPGGRHSSVDLCVPTIMRPRVRISSSTFTLFSVCNWIVIWKVQK